MTYYTNNPAAGVQALANMYDSSLWKYGGAANCHDCVVSMLQDMYAAKGSITKGSPAECSADGTCIGTVQALNLRFAACSGYGLGGYFAQCKMKEADALSYKHQAYKTIMNYVLHGTSMATLRTYLNGLACRECFVFAIEYLKQVVSGTACQTGDFLDSAC